MLNGDFKMSREAVVTYFAAISQIKLQEQLEDRPDFSSGRADRSGTALARTNSNSNYRPVLSSERALQNNKPQLSKRKSQGERKIGRGSQMSS
jgi:hypothetical protein